MTDTEKYGFTCTVSEGGLIKVELFGPAVYSNPDPEKTRGGSMEADAWEAVNNSFKRVESIAKTWIGYFGGYPEVFAFEVGAFTTLFSKDHLNSHGGKIVYNFEFVLEFDAPPVVVQSINEVFVRDSNENGRRMIATNHGNEFSIELLLPVWSSSRKK